MAYEKFFQGPLKEKFNSLYQIILKDEANKYDGYPHSLVHAVNRYGIVTVGDLKEWIDTEEDDQNISNIRGVGKVRAELAKQLVNKYATSGVINEPELIERTFIWDQKEKGMIEVANREENVQKNNLYVSSANDILNCIVRPFSKIEKATITMINFGSESSMLIEVDQPPVNYETTEELSLISLTEKDFYNLIRLIEEDMERTVRHEEFFSSVLR